MEEIKIDPDNQLSQEAKNEVTDILKQNAEIFNPDLPGYNNAMGKVEVTFEWASIARPPVNRAREADYNARGTELYNEKARELIKLGVLKKAAEINIQPAFKNNSFLVKKNKLQQQSLGISVDLKTFG